MGYLEEGFLLIVSGFTTETKALLFWLSKKIFDFFFVEKVKLVETYPFFDQENWNIFNSSWSNKFNQ